MRDWALFLDDVVDLVGPNGTHVDYDEAARLLLIKEELDVACWYRRHHPHPTWDLLDYALLYVSSDIPF